ncbi:hypothetical protein GCM10007028_21430 [Algibacter mikhailovii]|uniref:Uncharacterized protein n=2 Tax=Algibacter mikhailovii TaxID=425498 RepID=A0A918R5T1_9FLAO|nr:hypothetical protein GCM10007028_21430 [Algibacter mikhailovii]
MKTKILFMALIGAIITCNAQNKQSDNMASTSKANIDRSTLPIQPPPREPVTIMDARDVEKPETF